MFKLQNDVKNIKQSKRKMNILEIIETNFNTPITEDHLLTVFETLEEMNIGADKKEMLRVFGENLMNRNV